jgi:hypothetical protein
MLFKEDYRKYQRVHYWLYEKYGKANHCENDETHKSFRFEWANISDKYLKNKNDWKQLCVSCHRKMDYTEEQRERTRRVNRGNKYHNIKIKQYDKDGKFIKEWRSSMEVKRKLHILHTSISNVLAGKAKTAGGFIWQR